VIPATQTCIWHESSGNKTCGLRIPDFRGSGACYHRKIYRHAALLALSQASRAVIISSQLCRWSALPSPLPSLWPQRGGGTFKAQRREGDAVQRILDGLPKNPTRRRMLLPPLAG